jgi:hypothetical protein
MPYRLALAVGLPILWWQGRRVKTRYTAFARSSWRSCGRIWCWSTTTRVDFG